MPVYWARSANTLRCTQTPAENLSSRLFRATEYAIIMNEGYINAGQAPIYDNPYEFGEGTDWVDEVLNHNAPIMKHDLSISGANDNVNYALSAGYLTREGTVGGNFDRSNYERITVRSNIGVTIWDKSTSHHMHISGF